MGTTGGYWQPKYWSILYYEGKFTARDNDKYFPNKTLYKVKAGEVDDYYTYDSIIYLPEDVVKKCQEGAYTFKALDWSAFSDWEIKDSNNDLVCAYYKKR